MKKLAILIALAGAATFVQAQQYQCKVYCASPSGHTYVKVKASSAGDAAKIVDGQGDQICRSAGHSKATSSTMSASQCSRD